MSHTYISELVHIVFSHERARSHDRTGNEGSPLVISRRDRAKERVQGSSRGWATDHVHLLISLPATLAVAKAVQLLKGGSSKWLNEIVKPRFEWQEGYGAFSVGISQENATINYINSQEQHHRTHSFEDEFLAFLRRHRIEYDSRYVLG